MLPNVSPRRFAVASFSLSFAIAALLAWGSGCSVAAVAGSAIPLGGDGGGQGVATLADGASAAAPSTDAAGSASDSASAPADAQPSSLLATFLTLDTSQYLTDGDGGALVATSSIAGPGATFALTDLNGGFLTSGDPISLAFGSGTYLSAADDDAGTLTFVATAPGASETFLLVLTDGGGPIVAGNQVALQAKASGRYVSAINGGGGEVLADAPWDRAWETFTLGLGGGNGPPPVLDAGGPTAGDDAGSAASAARQKVLAFLAGISGNHTAIGVEDKAGGEADSDQMATMAGDGQNPSFWSADWGFGGAAEPSAREAIVQEGEKQWGEGALVQYIYHACPLIWGSNEEGCQYSCDPPSSCTNTIDGSFGDLTDAQWTDLTTGGGTLNGVWLARLDTLATYFQELKVAGVAPLFRPLHEINGAWAWWQGRPGPTGSALLYQITHDYLVNVKGLDNIIWVWNVQDYTTLASDVTVYTPGTSYFDVAAIDVYDVGYTTGDYNAMIGAAMGKPIGISECQFLPTTATLAAQPLWAYVAVWPDYLYSPNQDDNTAQIPALFADPSVLTLSAMPGW